MFCKSCDHEIVFVLICTLAEQFHVRKSYKTRESTLSCIGNFEENIDLSHIYLAVLISLKICTSGNRTSGNHNSRGPPVHFIEIKKTDIILEHSLCVNSLKINKIHSLDKNLSTYIFKCCHLSDLANTKL